VTAPAPRVSIIVPCFNGASTLSQTLDSVRAQTFAAWETIVVDDGSRDLSGELIAEYEKRDARITGLAQPNRGLGGARNTGLARARGEFVVFLDADDLLQPRMLDRLVQQLESDPSIAVAHAGWMFADPELHDLSWKVRASANGTLFDRLAHGNLFPCHSLMVRRSVLEATGDFDASIRHCHDWDLWIRVARTGARFAAVSEPLVVYRMQRMSLSRNPRTFFDVGAEVLRRAHRPDPRVRRPAPGLEQGCQCTNTEQRRLGWLGYCVGLALAQGNDVGAFELVDTVLGTDRHQLTPAHFGNILLALHFGAAIPWRERDRLMAEVGAPLLRFLVAEEAASKRPGFAIASVMRIINAQRPGIEGVSAREMLATLPGRILRRIRGGVR
jgi:hypothetical protein